MAPVGFVRDAHRDVIAEIANELLRVEGTSIAITLGVTTRGVEASVRADSRLLGQDQQRIVRVIDYLLGQAFPGLSGFRHDRRPPHRVEGGACVPLTPDQRAEWRLDNGGGRVAGNGPVLAHCQELARQLVASLRDFETASRPRCRGCSTWWPAPKRPCPATGTPGTAPEKRPRKHRRSPERAPPRRPAKDLQAFTEPRLGNGPEPSRAGKRRSALRG